MPVAGAFARFQNQPVFNSLDGLRAIAIIAVIWHHAAGDTFPQVTLASQGFHGVSLFFALSGFLITSLLLREKDRFNDISLAHFYIRRSLRIFPLYYAVIAIYLALVLILIRDEPSGQLFLHNLKYFLSYTSNIFVEHKVDVSVIFFIAWSLAAEEQFYLAWPPLLKFLGVNVATGIMVAFLVLAVFSQEIMFGNNGAMRGIFHLVQIPICCGVIAAVVLHQEPVFNRCWKIFSKWYTAPFALVLLIASLAAQLPSTVSYVLMAVLVVSCAVNEENGLGTTLRQRWIAHIGRVSYAMYLFHVLVLALLARMIVIVGPGWSILKFPLALLLTWGLATLSYRWFESYFLNLKKNFQRLSAKPL